MSGSSRSRSLWDSCRAAGEYEQNLTPAQRKEHDAAVDAAAASFRRALAGFRERCLSSDQPENVEAAYQRFLAELKTSR